LNTYIKDSKQKAQACVIWMHGLGADAQDMVGLVEQLPTTAAIRHVFIDAPVRPVTLNNRMPMRAWYDILGMKLTDGEDSVGIAQSEKMIHGVIDQQLREGFSSQQIFLAGFSQGAAMALYTGLRMPMPLGGIMALSGYLLLQDTCKPQVAMITPIFMAAGKHDPLVLPAWSKQGIDFLHKLGYQQITYKEYPMEHSICAEEIMDLTHWFTNQLNAVQPV